MSDDRGRRLAIAPVRRLPRISGLRLACRRRHSLHSRLRSRHRIGVRGRHVGRHPGHKIHSAASLDVTVR